MERVADEVSSPGQLSLRGALVSAFRGVMRLYFRRIERVGHPPGPETRGRVFVANHNNGLIDPILVITDAACEISPIAKSTLWAIPGLRWLLDHAGAVPIVRRKDAPDKDASSNAAMFARIATHLARGGNILIFPEGTSHSEPQLAPLRSGAARMLEAAQLSGADATFQAVALEFDQRDDFRSRCLILWGPVRRFSDLPDDLPGDPAGATDARVAAATARMDADLRELLVEADTHEERMLIARVAQMLANDANDGSLEGWNTIGRQVELASRTLRGVDLALVSQVATRIDAYYAELDRLGVRDAQVVARTVASEGSQPRRATRARRLAMLAPLAIPGFALYSLPYFIPRLVARRSDADAVSTVKLGVALLVYPVWMAGLVGVSMLLPPPLSLVAAAVAIASPFAALSWLDAWWGRDRHTPTADEVAVLARLRIAARTAIDEARARLGTDVAS